METNKSFTGFIFFINKLNINKINYYLFIYEKLNVIKFINNLNTK